MTFLPAGWRWSTVENVGRVDLGRQRHPEWHTGPEMYPYLRVANVFEDRIDTTDLKEMDFSGVFDRYKLEPGDVLLNEGQSPELLGRPAIYRGIPENVAFTNTLLRFRAGSDVLPEWALVVFRRHMHCRRFVREARITTNIAHLSASRLKAVEFPVPPLGEQRRIVDTLEDHLSCLDAAKTELDAADLRSTAWRRSLLLRAVLGGVEAVPVALDRFARLPGSHLGGPREPDIHLPEGWAWAKWRDIGTCQNGKAFPSREYCTTGVRLLRPGNMGPLGLLRWTDAATRFLPSSYRESSAALMLFPGDLVMNLTAQSLKDDFLGRVCLVKPGDEALLNQRIARLRPREVEPEFALLVFRSPLFRKYVKSLNSGSLIQHMFTKQVNEFWFPIPPKLIQRRLVGQTSQHEEAIVRLADASDSAKLRCVALRQALLEAAFSGRLTGRASDMNVVEETAGV